MKRVEKLIEESIESKLCCHCGVCVGVCPVQAITIKKNVLDINIEKCIDCGLCLECCPASGYELSDLTMEDIQDIPMYSIAAKNKEISEKASSGGFVTQSLLTLLDRGEITHAAVVITGDNLDESLAKYEVTNDKNIIMKARRSKYTQASLDKVLEYIKKNEGKYAIVGLPCQLYGVAQAMKKNKVLEKRIIYKFGMICGYTYEEECINGLAKIMKIKNEDIKRIIGWREGGLPGNFSLETKDGQIHSLPFIDEHSLDVTYYAQNRCKLCKDCLCENGDVVSADIGGWRERRTLALVRNSRGKDLLEMLKNLDVLDIKKYNENLKSTVLPFMLREKRSKVDLRLKKYISKKPIWIGGYSPKLLLSQKIEAFLSFEYEKIAKKNKDKYSAEKMLSVGKKVYYKNSSIFILKILYKLQIYVDKLIKLNKKLFAIIFSRFSVKLKKVLKLNSSKKMKVAIIGLGKWGSQYINFLNNSKYFEPIVIYDTNKEKLSFLSDKYKIGYVNKIEELYQNNKIEAIFVLTSTLTHYNIFQEIAKYNLPVYMEKPITTDIELSDKMLEISTKYNCMLYVAHSMKYEPIIKEIKKLLDNKVFGKIESFEITRTVKYRDNSYYENAALYQIGVHIIDIVLFLFGNIGDIIFKESNISKNENYENLYINLSKNCSGKLKYGFTNTFNFSIKIRGEKAIMTYADSKLKLYTAEVSQEKKWDMINEKTIEMELREFYYAIKNQEKYLNTIDNAIEIIRICEKIKMFGE